MLNVFKQQAAALLRAKPCLTCKCQDAAWREQEEQFIPNDFRRFRLFSPVFGCWSAYPPNTLLFCRVTTSSSCGNGRGKACSREKACSCPKHNRLDSRRESSTGRLLQQRRPSAPVTPNVTPALNQQSRLGAACVACCISWDFWLRR